MPSLFANPSQKLLFPLNLKDKQGLEFSLADPKAIRALLACMNMSAVLGGAAAHWGGPSAFVEIMSALYALVFSKAKKHNKNWSALFHLIQDAGHCQNGLYALLANYQLAGLSLEDLKYFRSLQSPLTGHGESHVFPQGVYLSNGPLGSTVGQAQGLAMADKYRGFDRTTILSMSDGACMEGESKEALNAIPGLAFRQKINPFLLLISYNNTKLTGRIDQDSFSLEPFLKSLSVLGWDSSFVPKGNDLPTVFDSIQQALEKLSRPQARPIALIFKTCKGFGVQKTVEDPSGGHGFPLKSAKELPDFVKEIYGGLAIPPKISQWIEDLQQPKKILGKSEGKLEGKSEGKPESQASAYFKTETFEKVQVGVSKALIEKKNQGRPLVSISSDLYGSTGLGPFRKKFPQESFDMGVAESNMISVAVGFSKQGFIPVVDTFSQFGVTKGALPFIMSALSQAPVIAVFSHAGFQDSADGASHQSLSHFAKTCSLPHSQVFALSCSEEAYHLVSQAVEEFYQSREAGEVPKSSFFFLGRETFPPSYGASSYDLKKAQILWDQSDKEKPVLIVSCGALVKSALVAGKILRDKGRGSIVINSPGVSDPDTQTLAKALAKCEGRLLVVEDHQKKGGLGSQILLALHSSKNNKIPIQFKLRALQGGFGRSAYTAEELYRSFGLDSESIVREALEFL